MQPSDMNVQEVPKKHIHMSRTVFVVLVTSFAMLVAITTAFVVVNSLNSTTSTDSRSQAAYGNPVRTMTGGVTNPQQNAEDPMKRALLMMETQIGGLEAEESEVDLSLLGNYDVDQLNGR